MHLLNLPNTFSAVMYKMFIEWHPNWVSTIGNPIIIIGDTKSVIGKLVVLFTVIKIQVAVIRYSSQRQNSIPDIIKDSNFWYCP